jgi:hypothetical protein
MPPSSGRLVRRFKSSVRCVHWDEKSDNLVSGKGIVMKREIRAVEAVRDIRQGINDLELMEKYKITDKGLRSLLKKLVAVGLLSQQEVDNRDSTFLSTVTLDLEDLNA